MNNTIQHEKFLVKDLGSGLSLMAGVESLAHGFGQISPPRFALVSVLLLNTGVAAHLTGHIQYLL